MYNKGAMKAKKDIPLQFPKRFYWGAATSGHQVEGGLHDQWTVWELEHAKVLAKQAKYQAKHLPKWESIKDEAEDPNNYTSSKAVDHYNRYEEDFDILKDLNFNAFRFSIEWSRIEPEEGVWNAKEIEHYRNYLRSLKKKGIEPFVTLWHWTMPVWFTKKGAFEKRSNVKYFVRFARKVFEELGREFRYITILNEPETYLGQSYIINKWPPMKDNKIQAFWVYLNLICAHKKVAKLARSISRRFIIGIAHNTAYRYAGDDTFVSRAAVKVADWGVDYFLLNRLKRSLDFIGLNYYFSDRFCGYKIHSPNKRQNDLGWDMQPDNVQYVLERIYGKYKLPIIITENGLADGDDEFRKWWLGQTLLAMHKALQNGVKLEGYLHWSLLDNFEWASGFWPKFGLVEVDRKTQERKIRPSAKWFASVIAKLRRY